ncbi:MAG: type II CAAX prenyl endopeptidase Rce1 family protein [Aeromicrobium sp.]
MSTLRRRRVATGIVVVIGAIMLGVSLRIEPGSVWFYPATVALALVWTVGAFASGPLHLGRIAGADRLRHPLVSPVLIGMGLAAMFVLGALVVRQISFLDVQVRTVLEHADHGSWPMLVLITTVNGVAEELFFRGAAYASIRRQPVTITTAAYALATFATGNMMLAFAAVLLGVVVGLERRASGGILAPALTHVTWSLAMLFALPLLFG